MSSSRRRRALGFLRRFGRVAWDCGVTGLAAMLAYNILLGIVPLSLLGLFIAGHVLSSASLMHSVERDLQYIFPNTTQHTLDSLLNKVSHSTTSTGVLALIASLWLASSFWGGLDTSFSRIYGCNSRPWIAQKRFGIAMVGVVLLFMAATVSVPVAQSLLKAGASDLPFDLRHVDDLVYAASVVAGLVTLFGCLSLIYWRVPNLEIPWHGVWPGALFATVVIGAIDVAFPVYLTSISTIDQLGTTLVFVVIVLGWFYVLALTILAGGVVNSLALTARSS
jgi:membrane protein